MFKTKKPLVLLLLLAVLLGACNKPTPAPTDLPAEPGPTTENTAAASPTPEIPPTATPMPAAAHVNGEPIPLAYYQGELQRYRASLDPAAAPNEADQEKTVLDALIDQQLMAQAARAAGFSLSDADLQSRIEDLVVKLQASGIDLGGWMQNNFYDDASFRYGLRLAAEAAWQRDELIAAVPETAEQVHVRQIFFEKDQQSNAQTVLGLLNNGSDFDTLARRYNAETGGELGWFPRGYLSTYPIIEETAFAMHPGTFSDLIETEIGYHILYLVESDPAHPLTTEARLVLQGKALEDWLAAQRGSASISIP